MEWKEEHDLLLCREILVCQPYKFKERTVERGKIWEEISNHLNTCETAKFRVNKRSVRERFKLIKEKFKRKIREEENSSGIDVEPTSELEESLEEICSSKNLSRLKRKNPSEPKKKKTSPKHKEFEKKQWRAMVRPNQELPEMKLPWNLRRKREEEAMIPLTFSEKNLS